MLIETIMDEKKYEEAGVGQVMVDYCVVNDGKALEAVRLLEESGRGVKNADRVLIIQDRVIPPNTPEISAAQHKLMDFAEKYSLPYHYGSGMTAQLLTEQYVKSGDVVVGCERNIMMIGAVGALGICLGPAKMAQAMAYGKCEIVKPAYRLVNVTGTLNDSVTAKDAGFSLLKQLQGDNQENNILVLTGTGLETLTLQDKMVLCGLMEKTGAYSALIDETAPGIVSSYQLNLTEVELMTACPGGCSVIEPAASIPVEAVRVVFVGGTYGGSLEDIRLLADQIRGRKIAYELRLVVAPATAKIYIQAANAGYIRDIMEAGGLVINQCGSADVQARIGRQETMVSNDIYNGKGYAGFDSSRIYLASTTTAAICALSGRIGG